MKVMSKAHEKSFHPKVAHVTFLKVQNDVIIKILLSTNSEVTNVRNIFTNAQVLM